MKNILKNISLHILSILVVLLFFATFTTHISIAKANTFYSDFLSKETTMKTHKMSLDFLLARTNKEAKIIVVGDIMMHGGQIRSGYIEGEDTYDFKAFFKDIKPFIEAGDLKIANLETTLAGDTRPYSGYPLFNAPDQIIDALKYAGFDTLVTANNHSLDTRIVGLIRTQDIIKKKGLKVLGTYGNETNENYVIKNVNGIKIAMVAYTEHINGLEKSYASETLESVINTIDEEKIISDMKKIRNEDPDLILAYMHWGSEYAKEPNKFQKYYSKLMAELGVDLILGSHPHVIQKSDTIKVYGEKSYVFYSLGNFISNQRKETLGKGFEATEDGVILSIDIQKDLLKNETTVKGFKIIPTWVDRNRRVEYGNYTYRIIPIETHLSENESVEENLYNRLMRSYNETIFRIHLKDPK